MLDRFVPTFVEHVVDILRHNFNRNMVRGVGDADQHTGCLLLVIFYAHAQIEKAKSPGVTLNRSLHSVHPTDTVTASENLKDADFWLTAKCIPQLSGFKYKDYSSLVVNCKFRQVPKVIVGL